MSVPIPPASQPTAASILAQILPIIESYLAPVIDAALAQAGPIGPAVAAALAGLVPVILAQLPVPATAAQASAMAAALAQLDATIAAMPGP